LHPVSFAAEYRQQVFEYFLREQRAGRTANPDILCNSHIKFGVALRYVQRLGATRFATGHYATLRSGPEGTELHKGADPSKDQSYFLHAVEQSQLQAVVMPLGGLLKCEVRTRARRAGLPVWDKPDSTGICFVGERPFREFLARYLEPQPGPIESADGELLGTHQGLAFYTLGQRAGLHIGGRRGRAEQPWYVAGKESARNALIVVQGQHHRLLYSTALRTEVLHWLVNPRHCAFACAVKVRYRQAEQAAWFEPQEDGTAQIRFEQPQRAVTPGQFAVLYEGSRCLGGAVIAATAAAGFASAESSASPARTTARAPTHLAKT
ncbi:MAG: tRNA 2-thiouridine(34) synthase MnmA, partial [Sinobacteraceae bacterium]|nr:tRNA 2-thiouridine(34) synthase MnmA [Nevskiaceae bacterium]